MPWKHIGCLGYSQKGFIFEDSDPLEAAGHSNWHMFLKSDDLFQGSDPPEAAGHSNVFARRCHFAGF